MNEQEKIFIEKLNNPENKWWDIIRNDKDFRIDLRRMATRSEKDKGGFKEDYPQINVYYCAGSFMRIYYTKTQGFKAVINKKYIFGKNSPKGDVRFNLKDDCLGKDKLKNVKDKICKNILDCYDEKERTFEMNYSADSKNNILITEYTGVNKTNDERNKKEDGKNINNIRIDMVRVNKDGEAEFIELKLNSNDELYKEKDRNIKQQQNTYRQYRSKHPNMLKEIQEHYEICKAINLPCVKNIPMPTKLKENITIMVAVKKGGNLDEKRFLLTEEVKNKQIKLEQLPLEDYYKQ